MFENPIRLFRRWRRLRAAVDDETAYLRKLHGRNAARAAAEKLQRPDLTSWGRLVVKRALRQLEREPRTPVLADELPPLAIADTSYSPRQPEIPRNPPRPQAEHIRLHAFSDHD